MSKKQKKTIDSHALDQYISIDTKTLVDAVAGLPAQLRFAFYETVIAVIEEKLHPLIVARDNTKDEITKDARASGQKTISTDFVRMSLKDEPLRLDLALFRTDFKNYGPTIGKLVLDGRINLSQKDILTVVTAVKEIAPTFITSTPEEKVTEYMKAPAQKGTGACVIKAVNEYIPDSLRE